MKGEGRERRKREKKAKINQESNKVYAQCKNVHVYISLNMYI